MKWLVFLFLCTCATAQDYVVKTVNLTTSHVETRPRIIGGTNTTINKYPYIVQVNYYSSAVCGGSLLTNRHVLTAAHCFFNNQGERIDPRLFSIRAGSTTLNSGGSVHDVSAIIIHESYNPFAHDHDIAVLYLTTNVTLGPTVDTASILVQGTEVPDNSTVIHLGWGTTNAAVHTPPEVLQEVQIQVVNRAVCHAQYQLYGELVGLPGHFPVTNNMICSGLLGIGGKDACQGDSGGPLEFGAGTVVGVTSWGAGCGEPLFPGVNTRVSAYSNWIEATVGRFNASSPVGQLSGILMIISVITTLLLCQ